MVSSRFVLLGLGVLVLVLAGALVLTRDGLASDGGDSDGDGASAASNAPRAAPDAFSAHRAARGTQPPCVCRAECDLGAVGVAGVLATPAEFAGMLDAELTAYLDAHVYMKGLLDSEAVSWLVATLLPRYDTASIFAVDIGANVGQTAHVLHEAFNNEVCRRLVREVLEPRGHIDLNICDAGGRAPVRIVSFEPDPNNLELIRKTGSDNRWDKLGWDVVPLAVSSSVGEATFYVSEPGSQTSSLFKPESQQQPVRVNMTTLDVYLADPASGLSGLLPFYVKIDTEGYDPDVLEGAARLLRERRIKFIVFEYNHVWQSSVASGTPADRERKRLHTVVGKLHAAGYACMLIGPHTLVPVTPPSLWQARMEFNGWSNVFCGLADDPEYCEVVTAAAAPHARSFAMSYFHLLRQGRL